MTLSRVKFVMYNIIYEKKNKHLLKTSIRKDRRDGVIQPYYCGITCFHVDIF